MSQPDNQFSYPESEDTLKYVVISISVHIHNAQYSVSNGEESINGKGLHHFAIS